MIQSIKLPGYILVLLFVFALFFLLVPSSVEATGTPWKMLVLVYRNIDVDYVDLDGQPKHLTATMPQTDADNMIADFLHVPHQGLVYGYSDHYGELEADIVYVARAITHITYVNQNDPSVGYWIDPEDVRTELDTYAPKGKYDSIEVLWQASHPETGQSVPLGGWGWGGGPFESANGATYASIFNLSWWWTYDPCLGEVFLHEWLHGVTGYYMSMGYRFPPGDLHGAGENGYAQDPNGCWTTWYRDYMRGRVYVNGTPTGITEAAWNAGTPITGKPDLRPYAPPGYSYPIVPSSVTNTTDVNTLFAGRNTYLDWHFINSGSGIAPGTFYVELWVDNVRHIRYPQPNYSVGGVGGFDDWTDVINEPGWHTLRLITDPDNTVIESDESNNIWEMQFYWEPTITPTPTLTPTPTATPTNTLTPTNTPTVTPTNAPKNLFEDNDPAVQYTGTWTTANATSASGGTYHYSSQTNAMGCITIDNATQFQVTTITGGNRGIANVLVDGLLVGTFDAYGSIVYGILKGPYPLPDLGQHTICVQVSGVPHPGATGTVVVLDNFVVDQVSGPACYTLTTAASPANGGNVTVDRQPDCNNNTQYSAGTAVILTANPNTNGGYSFANWSTGDTANPLTVTMDSDKNITANFSGGSEPTELLLNPGFELDKDKNGIPDNWGTNTKFRRVGKPHVEGGYAGRLSATDNKGVTISQKVPNLTAGATYAASCRVNIPATTDTFSFKVQVRWYNSLNKVIGKPVVIGPTFTTKTNGWVLVASDIIAPANTKSAQVQLVATSLKTKIHVDDCSLTQVS